MVTMLIAELVSRGHDIALAAPSGTRDADLLGIPYIRFPLVDHGRQTVGATRSTLELARAVRRFSPDVIHAQNVKSSVAARGSALLNLHRAPPVLTTFHGVLPAEYGRAAKLLRTATQVACVSADLLGNLTANGFPKRRATLIRNAITPASRLQDADRAILDDELEITGAPVIAVVGRLVAQKAHERFIVAARQVADRVPEARFLIVGDGPRRAEIEALAATAGLSSRVRFTGVRSDAREIIARADIVAFSSDWEGLSIAALEALAAGTPVVSTDVQGMRGLLESGGGAIVPLDDGTALGERIVGLLHSESDRRTMGSTGRTLIAHDYSIDRMVANYEEVYTRLSGST